LKRLLADGHPVIVELGIDPPGEYAWMEWYGHYLLVVAYDEDEEQFWVYDSWFGTSEVPGENASPDGRIVSYDDLAYYWQQFNNNYIVLYRPEEEAAVHDIIGQDMDDDYMWQQSLVRVQTLLNAEPEDAFLWFNLGTVYNALGDFEKAATAFDQARNIGLPWRMLWYQFGPYQAYYEVGRYEDVILLADTTLMDRPYFEESFYYKGLALAAMGNVGQARDNLERAVRFNPNFAPAAEALAQLPE
jgi:tetratricopeptide (TPR) repeat protein